MIIWLASYPRSGNTLLRTMLKQSMDMDSYSDEPPPKSIGFSKNIERQFGHLDYAGSWDSFYDLATTSDAIFFVKTHLPPRDQQPVIHVVRDGRRSIFSYWRYHQSFFPEHSGGLWDLVLGADYYGDWSEHYEAWNDGARKRLLLRYEDLVGAPGDAVSKLVNFIGRNDVSSKWINSFEQLNKQNPHFFRQGRIEWDNPSEWTKDLNGAFFHLHGALMCALGYAERSDVDEAREGLTTDMVELIELVTSIQSDRRRLAGICQDRLDVINALERKVGRYGVRNASVLAKWKRLVTWVR
ncbi:MAG TPA: sulfotransferase domain-containing protein [Denitromonas sp.]|nr:sulfotransferase domain-containing protein [Chromatiaceae bacterium]HPR05664.1 sulfotransferase domain-containing protein [Denitromonas sp.]